MKKLTKKEIHRILSRHRGALSELARNLNVSRVHVHHVLAGKSQSERVMMAAEEAARVMEERKSAA